MKITSCFLVALYYAFPPLYSSLALIRQNPVHIPKRLGPRERSLNLSEPLIKAENILRSQFFTFWPSGIGGLEIVMARKNRH